MLSNEDTNMMIAKLAALTFCEGDEVVLAKGSYQDASGIFIRLKEDPNWADIREPDGTIRSHPAIWLAHNAKAIPGCKK